LQEGNQFVFVFGVIQSQLKFGDEIVAINQIRHGSILPPQKFLWPFDSGRWTVDGRWYCYDRLPSLTGWKARATVVCRPYSFIRSLIRWRSPASSTCQKMRLSRTTSPKRA